MKWLILIVLLILVAPNIARQFSKEEQAGRQEARRGLVYRAVARFGPRPVFIAFLVVLVLLAVAVFLLVRRVA